MCLRCLLVVPLLVLLYTFACIVGCSAPLEQSDAPSAPFSQDLDVGVRSVASFDVRDEGGSRVGSLRILEVDFPPYEVAGNEWLRGCGVAVAFLQAHGFGCCLAGERAGGRLTLLAQSLWMPDGKPLLGDVAVRAVVASSGDRVSEGADHIALDFPAHRDQSVRLVLSRTEARRLGDSLPFIRAVEGGLPSDQAVMKWFITPAPEPGGLDKAVMQLSSLPIEASGGTMAIGVAAVRSVGRRHDGGVADGSPWRSRREFTRALAKLEKDGILIAAGVDARAAGALNQEAGTQLGQEEWARLVLGTYGSFRAASLATCPLPELALTPFIETDAGGRRTVLGAFVWKKEAGVDWCCTRTYVFAQAPVSGHAGSHEWMLRIRRGESEADAGEFVGPMIPVSFDR